MSTVLVTLGDVIAWVESRNDCSALRFEPTTWEKLSEGRNRNELAILALTRAHNACSHGTADMIYSTSWGKYQIMGFNLYGPECALQTGVMAFCVDDAAQDAAFAKLIAAMRLSDMTPPTLADSPDARAHFARVWNGSTAYVEPLVEALRHFNFQIKG